MEKNKKLLIVIVIVLCIIDIGLSDFFISKEFNKKSETSIVTNDEKNTSDDNNNDAINDEKNTSDDNNNDAINDEEIDLSQNIIVSVEWLKKSKEIKWASKITDELKIDNKNALMVIKYYGEGADTYEYVLDETGSVYVNHSDSVSPDYKKIDTNFKVKRIGYMDLYPLSDTSAFLILQSEDGKMYIYYDSYDYDKEELKELSSVISNSSDGDLSYFPISESVFDKNLDYLLISNNGMISFNEHEDLGYIKDDNTNIIVKYLIAEMNSKGIINKYYIISNTNKLYIIDKIDNRFSSSDVVKNISLTENSASITLKSGSKLLFDNAIVFN